MKLHELSSAPGATHRRKRVGRGDSSGLGRTCGRGEKGQKSRSGSTIRPHFEGGQIPLFRRLPKRGFNHPTHKEYNLVNVSTLEEFFDAGAEVDAEALRSKGVIRKNSLPLKGSRVTRPAEANSPEEKVQQLVFCLRKMSHESFPSLVRASTLITHATQYGLLHVHNSLVPD